MSRDSRSESGVIVDPDAPDDCPWCEVPLRVPEDVCVGAEFECPWCGAPLVLER
jgi:hypothetical protein